MTFGCRLSAGIPNHLLVGITGKGLLAKSFTQEPLEISEEILIKKQNTEIVLKQNILTNATNQQQIAVTPVTHQHSTLLAK